VIDWLLRDRRTGRWVVVQAPNLPLLVWLVTVVLRWFWHARALDVVGTTALVVWAGDEVARGVNPFRRLLGAAVLAALVVRWVSN
jgi:hypothetical protein